MVVDRFNTWRAIRTWVTQHGPRIDALQATWRRPVVRLGDNAACGSGWGGTRHPEWEQGNVGIIVPVYKFEGLN